MQCGQFRRCLYIPHSAWVAYQENLFYLLAEANCKMSKLPSTSHMQQNPAALYCKLYRSGRTLFQLPTGFCRLSRGSKGQDHFPLQNCELCKLPCFFHAVMLLQPPSSKFLVFPNLPLENNIIHTAMMNLLCHCKNNFQATEIRKSEN